MAELQVADFQELLEEMKDGAVILEGVGKLWGRRLFIDSAYALPELDGSLHALVIRVNER